MDFSKPPVNPNDPGISHALVGGTWPFTIIAIGVVTLRFYVRKRHAGGWAIDDWIMLAALACQILYQAFLATAVWWGFGKAFINLTLEQLVQSQKYQFYLITPAVLTDVIARISISILLVRIFGMTRPWFKWFLIYFTAVEAVISIVGVILMWVENSPVETYWDPRVVPTRQMDPKIEMYTNLVGQFLVAISDLAFVIPPVIFVSKLNMPLLRKLGIASLISASLVSFASAVAKLVIVVMAMSNNVDITMSGVWGYIYLASGIEQALVIIMGCVPALAPITKLQFPMLSRIGQSLVGLLSSGRRSTRASNKSGQSSSYRDIELGPKLRASDDNHSGYHSAGASVKAPSSRGLGGAQGLSQGSGNVYRKDEFVITYEDHSVPK